MDDSFAELAKMLNFRDKEQERIEKTKARRAGTLPEDEMEMDAWDKEMKVRYIAAAVIAHLDSTF